MRRTILIWLWLVVVSVVSGCSLLPRAPLATPGPAGSPAAGDLRTFDEEGLTFNYPAAWRELHFQVDSSFSHLIADLATVDVPEPCITTQVSVGTEVSCSDRYKLLPDSLVVSISSDGMPGFSILDGSNGATPMLVGGMPAYLRTESATSAGGQSLVWTLSSPGFVDNFYEVRAELLGPGLDQMRSQLDDLITSLRYDPPVVLLPSGPAAMATAEAKALAALVKDASVWTCFSPSGSNQMIISSMPGGPPLAQPQLATCTMKIEATPLQLWRMTLSIRLDHADPNVGTGETFTQWVNPDGTLGAFGGGPLAP